MDVREANQERRGYWLSLAVLFVLAVVLTIVIVLAIWPRTFAWTSPLPTPVPWTQAPGMYQIPTVTPPATSAQTVPAAP